MVKLIALSGSSKKQSFNQQLVTYAASVAQELGAEVDVLNLGDYPMPLFNEDDEAKDGTPDSVTQLKQRFIDADGILLACPEYNSSITPLLKNAIDWMSRSADSDPHPMAAFRDKTVGLLAASPGALGGLRGLVHVRAILSSIQAVVVPNQAAIGKAHEVLDAHGKPSVEPLDNLVRGVVQQTVDFATKLR